MTTVHHHFHPSFPHHPFAGKVPGTRPLRARESRQELAQTTSATRTEAARQPDQDWGGYTFEFLIGRVLRNQHTQIRTVMMHLQELAAATAKEAGVTRREITGIRRHLAMLINELTQLITTEEEVFPTLLDLEVFYVGETPASGRPRQVRQRIADFTRQHGAIIQTLDQIQAEANSLIQLSGSGHARRAFCDRLANFRSILLEHFYIEDDFLFCRANQMETELFCRTQSVRR